MLPILLFLSACEHQYIAVPGARVLDGTPQYYYTNVWAGVVLPTYTVPEGSLDLTVDSSVTVEFDVSAAFEFEITEIVLFGLEDSGSEFGDHWLYELSEEEVASKKALVTIQAVSERPTKEQCTPKHLGTWTCFQVADDGVQGIGFAAAGTDSVSIPNTLPLTLPSRYPSSPSDDSGGACSGYTAADCCTGSAGIEVVECAWDPSCACPDGTTDIGYFGDGLRRCACPG